MVGRHSVPRTYEPPTRRRTKDAAWQLATEMNPLWVQSDRRPLGSVPALGVVPRSAGSRKDRASATPLRHGIPPLALAHPRPRLAGGRSAMDSSAGVAGKSRDNNFVMVVSPIALREAGKTKARTPSSARSARSAGASAPRRRTLRLPFGAV